MYQAALPFIGFGFFDNFIMISAVSYISHNIIPVLLCNLCPQGEYIDSTIGVALGISTMTGTWVKCVIKHDGYKIGQGREGSVVLQNMDISVYS